MPAATAVKAVTVSDDPQVYEDEHVHAVYDEIAPHFSSTRYKPWPIIASFLASIPTGWVGLDSGTGNGKYLLLPSDRPGAVWTVGLDMSRNLLEMAQSAGGQRREVVWGNVLAMSWRAGAFDFVISVATIHHLSTPARRKLAVQRLLECISPSHGRALIYVWAIAQDELSKRNIPTEGSISRDISRKGQDVFVPWVLSSQPQAKTAAELRGKRKEGISSISPSPALAQASKNSQQMPDTFKIFNRYYHMFAQGELSELVREAAKDLGLVIGCPSDETDVCDGENVRRGVEIVQDGWERSNYYVELRCWQH
ncbi:S-adenosyl-L-methionine-dependent methyltransferase [Laetiporus sulphureus 93-53]|uniref:S-adenosyl-L-methionine-dependent methyltransferase n=1 Tax=Laetiporus sulphureus 93-53 TaxID=1314785 RepID=A0A165FVK8_9APHY|nr:S-adenosyl-L-methionine-dependent methyltransferase [Laetiporus sulphureus 93-53]KZT09467.1 S-adenosyl-L-methionine-dependent methyltransferase [Laetiporus sulphureus 93-53]